MIAGSLLERGILLKIRRNHSLEHATLQVLARRQPRAWMGGYSGPGGFWLAGNVPIEDVQQSVDEALTRLRAGESGLAIHPNCGTDFAISGIFAGTAAWLAMLGAGREMRDKWDRLPNAILFAMLALLIARPLGPLVQQRVTTAPHPGGLQVIEIKRFVSAGGLVFHKILTREA